MSASPADRERSSSLTMRPRRPTPVGFEIGEHLTAAGTHGSVITNRMQSARIDPSRVG
ncbi:MAG: hypothetical protein U5K37_00285 [Natrialbaceae archaeon]|nr:hypothetical protein [Natrialbaceae archaeon]